MGSISRIQTYNKKRHPNGCLFIGGAEGNRFAFAAMPQIKGRLGQALAGGAHPRRI